MTNMGWDSSIMCLTRVTGNSISSGKYAIPHFSIDNSIIGNRCVGFIDTAIIESQLSRGLQYCLNVRDNLFVHDSNSS